MKKYNYRLSYDDFTSSDLKKFKDQFNLSKYTMGDKVIQFEKKIANWLNVKNAIMVNSGSSANLLLITSLLYRSKITKNLLKKGDEILVPALAWSTTIWPLVQLGFKPVLVDIDINSLAIDLKSAEKQISKKTKAMFLIHVMGQACNMRLYNAFCKKYNLILLEDCCESFGAFYKKKSVGSFGYGGTISHYFSHHLSTIEGGTIITNDNNLADDLRSLRAHGWIRDRKDKNKFKIKDLNIDKRWFFLLPGYNVRPMEFQALLGLIQLKKININLLKRETIVKKIYEKFKKGPKWINIIGENYINKKIYNKLNRSHSWMSIPILISHKKFDSKEIVKYFEKNGIETRPIISGNITKHPVFKKINYKKSKNLKNTNIVHKKGFLIGCHPSVNQNSIDKLNKVFTELNQL